MSSEPAASVTPSSSSVWDRITTWASENKAIVYTIAGTIVIITGAGAVYYLSDARRAKSTPSTEKKKSKKERRNEKKKAEEQSKSGISLKDEEAGTRSCAACTWTPVTDASTALPTSKAPTVEPEEELPPIDERTIGGYSPEVCAPKRHWPQRHLRGMILMAHRNGNPSPPN
jgi:import receptor subunit TOM70